jgi:hypothetical protein
MPIDPCFVPVFNKLCLVLTFLAGYLIASSYARYRSWLFAGLEHALYGWMTFVIGS